MSWLLLTSYLSVLISVFSKQRDDLLMITILLPHSTVYGHVRTTGLKLHKKGLYSTCSEQFPEPGSWIKSRISLDYSLWWPLRVLSSGYFKHSPTTLRPAQRKLQGFGQFERFKDQAFRALITHSTYAWDAQWGRSAYLVMMEARMVFCTVGFVFLMAHGDLITHSFPARNCQII